MNDFHKESLHKIEELEAFFLKSVEDCYTSDEGGDTIQDEQLQGLKQKAIDSIGCLSFSIKYKLNLLINKLNTIKSFDWQKFHRFEDHKRQSDDNKVVQILHDGDYLISFPEKEIMEFFIYTELTSFFSTLSTVIDNLMLLVKEAFDLDISGTITVWKVYESLEGGSIKEVIGEGLMQDNAVKGMRDIRKTCEHYDHSKVFLFPESPSLGGRDLGVPHINSELLEFPPEENMPIDRYCENLYRTICDFLEKFSKVANTTKEN